MPTFKLDLKSVLSLIVACVFAWKAIDGTLDPTFVQAIILMVFTFFFSHQIHKRSGGE